MEESIVSGGWGRGRIYIYLLTAVTKYLLDKNCELTKIQLINKVSEEEVEEG